ncbi:MAG: hypothetical protein JJT76_18495 [Clostridiaceae bacterium]|nr:hypothetical protein [Clostridiaceae bacterium]
MLGKLKKALILISSLFLGGSLSVYIGLSKGRDISRVLSRPRGASRWTVSNELTIAWTYVPVIIGISLILLSIIFSGIVFLKWYED